MENVLYTTGGTGVVSVWLQVVSVHLKDAQCNFLGGVAS